MKTKIAAVVLAFGAVVATAGSASAAEPSTTWSKQATPSCPTVVNPWFHRPPTSGVKPQPWRRHAPTVTDSNRPVVWSKHR